VTIKVLKMGWGGINFLSFLMFVKPSDMLLILAADQLNAQILVLQ
jgi:hypothetical protein